MDYENDQYLWDKTGAPDEFVAGLERELAPLAMKAERRPVASPVARPVVQAVRPVAGGWNVGWGAVAAAVLAIAGTAWVARVSGPVGVEVAEPAAGWTLWRSSIGGGKTPVRSRSGERVVAGAGEYVGIESGEAWVTVAQESAVVLGAHEGRVELESGKVQAMGGAVVAVKDVEVGGGGKKGPKFWVETGERSSAIVRVEEGVATARGAKRFARIPAGFESRVEKGEPGLPLRPDAGKGMAYAVTMLEDVRGGMKGMFVIVDQARVEDAATLWNAAWRREDEMRKVVLTKLDELVPAPDRRVLEVWSEEGMELWWEKIVEGAGQ